MTPKDVIRELLLEGGLSQAELAKKAGYSHQSGIGNILNRNKTMRIDHFVKVCKALGYEVAVVKGGEVRCVLEESSEEFKYPKKVDTDERGRE